MGRRAQPAAVKEAKAAVRSKRRSPPVVAAAEGEVSEGRLKAPAWLKGEALQIWEKRGPILRDMRLLGPADEPAFARYCRNFAKWLQIRAALDRRGYTYDAPMTGGGKMRRIDPAFGVADRLERQLLALEDRFGMSPSERQRIMSQRAQPAQGNLFEPSKRPNDPAAEPTPAAEPIDSPIGLLN
jgi:P27 family predicted phage terminase small subunit